MFALGRHLLARVRQERGFGMVELLAAMSVMLVGVFALYGLFQAGIIQIRRASIITTATAIADAEIERFRAIKYASIGLDNADVAGADSAYTADSAYKADASPTTTHSGVGTSDTTISVASFSGFPASAPYLIQVDSERMLVTDGAGTLIWTVTRGYDGTTAASHPSGTVKQVQRAHLLRCGTAPCTNAVPTKTVAGADGKSYRVDTYITWQQVANSATPAATGRLLKLVTIVVRDDAAPYRTWARLSSSFDESTGL